MVLAGLGLNPAEVLPFRNHLYRAPSGRRGRLPRSCFPNLWHVLLGFLCLWLHCWGFFACACIVVALPAFLCVWLHHLSLSLGGSCRFGLESCWGSAVSEPRSTELLSDEGATSTELFSKPVACPAGGSLLVVALLGFLCSWLHHLSLSLGRQKATLESFKG